ncbi:MAG: DNA phosphorothioation-associated putative methyltransferase [Chthoniobacteraceae bacterium]
MQSAEFQRAVRALHYGKNLPDARYLLRPGKSDIAEPLLAEIHRAEIAAAPPSNWNLLKLHTDQFAISFLSYPDFDTDPHPALAEATKINLNTGSILRTDYRQRANPPILHRKETFLPPNDPRIPAYADLTKREEEAGLYRDPSRIGLRVQWLTLLKRMGVSHEGHTLVSVQQVAEQAPTEVEPRDVARHRTAIKRYDLSKPVKQLLERGLLRKNDSFFDFGCGHGMDVEALQNLGYRAAGWDPAFRPTAPKTPAAVVNLGYVLNVIEEPAERIATLREAYSLTERVLLVSTMVSGQETDSHSRPYRDGFLTKVNTFQKFYAPGELEGLIEQTLDAEASTLGLGLCVVFRSDDDAELFEANRNRRRIDWTEISAQLKFSAPISRERRSVDRYELHKELFEQFWQTLLELGRAPEPGEFDRLAEVTKAAGGIKRALALVVTRNGEQLWQTVRKSRTEDVLVYLAMTKFRKRFLRREIPLRIKNDIRSFFGDLPTAQTRARDLLFAAGDPGEIDVACEGVDVGWQDGDALMIHRSLLGELPPILRIYVHCAAYRYGDPSQADVIKIHKHSGKITFQHYDDFDGKPLPELQTRIKVNLRNLFVEVFDHSKGPRIQLLYFKERFVGRTYPGRPAMEKFSAKLSKLGLDQATIGLGPDKQTFFVALAAARLNENLNPRKIRVPSETEQSF